MTQVREYHASGEGKGMCTGRPGWQVSTSREMKISNKNTKPKTKTGMAGRYPGR